MGTVSAARGAACYFETSVLLSSPCAVVFQYLDEFSVGSAMRVVEWAPPFRKSWETLGRPWMNILDRYRIGFELTPRGTSSGLRVFIDYMLPDRGLARLMGRTFGFLYARWRVHSLVAGCRGIRSARS